MNDNDINWDKPQTGGSILHHILYGEFKREDSEIPALDLGESEPERKLEPWEKEMLH